MLDRLPCPAAISPLKRASGKVILIAQLERVLLVMNLYSNQLATVKCHAGRWSPLSELRDKNGCIRTKVNYNSTFGLLAQLPRLVSEQDINSLDKRTQALTGTSSDSLFVASFALDITLDYITLIYLHPPFATFWGVMKVFIYS